MFVYSPGDTVQCVLWDITKECEIALDMLEGYPEFYSKKFLPIEFMGHRTEAMIYYMVTQYYPSHPSISYQNMLEEGYIDHGLDVSQIYQAEGFNQYEYSY
jgi:hypothetical protein